MDDEEGLADYEQKGQVGPGELNFMCSWRRVAWILLRRTDACNILYGARGQTKRSQCSTERKKPDDDRQPESARNSEEKSINMVMRKKLYVFLENYPPVVNQTFSEEEIVAGEQEVPGESTEPREVIETVDGESDRDDFLEALELDQENLK